MTSMHDGMIVPPLKSQGIKTKLVPSIARLLPDTMSGAWVEPFSGTGVVGFNLAGPSAIMADTNPHIIGFYDDLRRAVITPDGIRDFLTESGEKLMDTNGAYYYEVRDRFNEHHDSMDFIFLNRACFNGMMRFNGDGGYNVPFCRKPGRFSKAYITKIVHQSEHVRERMLDGDYSFRCQGFVKTISSAVAGDIIYCDPPYLGRSVDYYGSWDESDELALFDALSASPAEFILSTWSHNKYRRNQYLDSIWGDYPRILVNHYYHLGGSESNRHGMVEALVHSPGLTVNDIIDDSIPQIAPDDASSRAVI